jgi:hypothetical protein
MKTNFSLFRFALCFAAGMAFCATAPKTFAINTNLFMGTWKLNEAKSDIENGTAKNRMVVYSAVGDHFKIVVDGTDTDGQPSRSEWVGKFDGRGYRVTGDRASDLRSYTLVNSRTMDFTAKHFGTVTVTGHIVVSADGKTRTVTTHRVDVNGKRFRSTAVYEKHK